MANPIYYQMHTYFVKMTRIFLSRYVDIRTKQTKIFFMCAGNNYLGNFVAFGIFYVRFLPLELTNFSFKWFRQKIEKTSSPEKNGIFDP